MKMVEWRERQSGVGREGWREGVGLEGLGIVGWTRREDPRVREAGREAGSEALLVDTREARGRQQGWREIGIQNPLADRD